MSLKLIIKDLGPIWDHRKIDTKKMAVFGHFLGFIALFLILF